MPTQSDALSDLSQTVQMRVLVSKYAVMVSSVIVVIWGLYFGFLGSKGGLLVIGLSGICHVITLYLYYRGDHWLARVFWFVSMAITTAVVTVNFEPQIDAELFMFCLIGTPFLYFSPVSERVSLIVLVVAMSILTLVTTSIDWLELYTYFPSPLIVFSDPQIDDTMNYGIRLTVGAVLLAELSLFAFMQSYGERKTLEALTQSTSAAKAKGEFLANMSHEIRTPMNGLIGMIEVLETTPLDNNQNATVSTIRNSAFSLLRIIDDILDASKMEAGKLDVDLTPVELMPLVEGVAQTLQTMADGSDVRLRMMADPAAPRWVMADSGRLRQILLNLVSNGIKYSSSRLTGRPGTVFFSTLLAPDGTLLFEVRDNGIGMGEDIRRNLFQPFVQGESSSRRQVSGTGLGLVISKNLIELMGGTVDVKSEEGVGTTLTVKLDLETAEGPDNLPDISGVRIICFYYHDQEIRRGMNKVFAESGATVLFTDNKHEAVEMANAHPEPSIIMLPTSDAIDAQATQTFLQGKLPTAKFVRHSAERSAKFGLQSNNTYLIQIFPMMISELMYAVALLSGRVHAPPEDLPTQAAATQAADHAKTARILVVEDNEINQAVLTKQLEILGYPHHVVSNGLEGLEEWNSGKYDLVLTDCHMPIMDGFELTSAIRSVEYGREGGHTPIIAITANALEGEAQRCLAAGMDAYLPKPVEMKALQSKLEQTLADHAPA